MVPAEGSEAVFVQMRKVVSECDDLVQAAQDFAAGIGGRIRVRCVLSATETVVPKIYRYWSDEVSGLVLDLDVLPPHRQLAKLEAGDCDIGLMRALVNRQGFHETIILREPLVLIIPKEWQKSEAIESLDDLSDRPMVRLCCSAWPGIVSRDLPYFTGPRL